jgi:hypothetical protein
MLLIIGMTICTSGMGPRWVWHPSGAGLEIDSWVHPNPPKVETSAGANSHPRVPIGPRQSKTYLIEFLTFLPKPAGTRNPLETRPETRWVRMQCGCGCHFPLGSFLGRVGFLSTRLEPAPLPSLTSIYTHLIEFFTFLRKPVGT